MKAEMKISRARAGLILTSPFFATLAMSMGAVEVGNDVTETMATDGKSLFYNTAFVEETPDDELRGVLVHEVLHVVFLHHTRRGKRDPELWNIATDFVINANVIKEGFALPAGCLLDTTRFPADMSADQVYSILEKEQAQGKKPQGNQIGDVKDAADPDDKPALQAAEMEARTKTINAAKAAAAAGKDTAMSKQLLDEARTTPRDIWMVLQRYVDSASRTTATWSKPNRRYVSRGIYVPGQMPDGLSSLAVIIDVSGSIDMDKLATFKAGLNAAVEASSPDVVQVIQCNTKVQAFAEFGPDEPIDFDVVGGGGTDMDPALAMVADSAACIVFTDCEFWNAPTDPGVPVLWARWGNGEAPAFGETIDIA